MRRFVIDQDTDIESLQSQLLDGRLGGDRAAAAVRMLQDHNPHVDFSRRLTAGTMLLIPDSRDFKASTSRAVADDMLDDLQQRVRNGLDAMAARLKEGNEARAAERTELETVLKSAAVKRVLADPEIKAELGDFSMIFKEEQRQESEAQRALESATQGVMAELTALASLLR
jgi:hypothetical protein